MANGRAFTTKEKKIMTTDEKEVFFHKYCKNCEHCSKDESEEPCNECLLYPMNYDSHKPVMFKEKEKIK